MAKKRAKPKKRRLDFSDRCCMQMEVLLEGLQKEENALDALRSSKNASKKDLAKQERLGKSILKHRKMLGMAFFNYLLGDD